MILHTVLERLADHAGEVRIGNVAAVVTLDRPKLGSHRIAMQHTLAELLGIEASRIGLVFKTSEGMALGHIQTRVTVLLAGEL